MTKFRTPILFITYNRPTETAQVLDRIRELKPQKLFIASDGPKPNKADREKLKEVRTIIEKAKSWNCSVELLFQNENLGCKTAVSKAISWFFDHVEEGIILEDDCLPDLSFFYLCDSLLEKYRYETKIMLISGSNFQNGIQRGNGSYYFSKYSAIWGWATWKRVWKDYDINISSFPDFKKDKIIQKIFSKKIEQLFWNYIFTNMHKGTRNTWDHQLAYTVMSRNGLSIVPNKNLVKNIGFNSASTRTTNSRHRLANMKTESIDVIIHPRFIIANHNADSYMFKHIYYPMIIEQLIEILIKLPRHYVKKIFNNTK